MVGNTNLAYVLDDTPSSNPLSIKAFQHDSDISELRHKIEDLIQEFKITRNSLRETSKIIGELNASAKA